MILDCFFLLDRARCLVRKYTIANVFRKPQESSENSSKIVVWAFPLSAFKRNVYAKTNIYLNISQTSCVLSQIISFDRRLHRLSSSFSSWQHLSRNRVYSFDFYNLWESCPMTLVAFKKHLQWYIFALDTLLFPTENKWSSLYVTASRSYIKKHN